MTILQRIAREPNAIGGLVLAIYGALVAFDVLVLTAAQFGSVTALAGAGVIALRWLTTPVAEVIAQKPPGQPATAGQASLVETGTPVSVSVTPLDD